MVGMIVFSAQANSIKRRSSARQKQAFVNFAFKGNLFKVIVQGIVFILWIYILFKTSLLYEEFQIFLKHYSKGYIAKKPYLFQSKMQYQQALNLALK